MELIQRLDHAISTKEKSICIYNRQIIIQVGNQHFWLWICIEPIHSSVWNLHIRGEKHACC